MTLSRLGCLGINILPGKFHEQLFSFKIYALYAGRAMKDI
jgi:hypothetical protein